MLVRLLMIGQDLYIRIAYRRLWNQAMSATHGRTDESGLSSWGAGL